MPYCFGYQRVSTTQQEESDLGLQSQAEAIEAYHRQKYAPQGYEWGGHYVDPAVSGNTAFLEREAGRLLSDRANRGDVILIHKIDRGFRRMADMLTTLETLDQRGIGVYFITEGLNTTDGAMGRLILHVLTAFAEFERTMVATRTRESMAILKARGQPLNRHDLLGFKWVGRKGNKRVVRDDHDRSVMNNIVKWRKIGISWNEIVDHIAKYDVLTSRGGAWNRSRVRRAFTAELY